MTAFYPTRGAALYLASSVADTGTDGYWVFLAEHRDKIHGMIVRVYSLIDVYI